MSIEDRLEHIENLLSEVLEAVNSRKEKTDEGQYGDVMNYEEAAKYLNRTVGALRVMVCNRKIPHSKRGGRVYFIKSDIEEWIKAGKKKAY